jgi:hypothetical protein
MSLNQHSNAHSPHDHIEQKRPKKPHKVTGFFEKPGFWRRGVRETSKKRTLATQNAYANRIATMSALESSPSRLRNE